MLTESDFEFFVGCCLGDGSIIKGKPNSKGFRLIFALAHSASQEEYIRWKAERMNAVFGRSVRVRSYNSKAGGKEYPSLIYSTGVAKFRDVYDLLYKEGKKTFTWEMLKPLGLQALALFWMDDGVFVTRTHVTRTDTSLQGGRPGKKGITRKYFREARLSLYTDRKQAELVNSWIKWLTGGNGDIYDQKGDGKYILIWRKTQFLRIVNRIKGYVHPSMYRKISLDGVSFALEACTIDEG
jgi:LAGLIDADG DNA endonuclease family